MDELNFSPKFVLSPAAEPMKNPEITVKDGADQADKGCKKGCKGSVTAGAAAALVFLAGGMILTKKSGRGCGSRRGRHEKR